MRIAVLLGLLVLSLPVLARPDCDKIRDDDLLCVACNVYHEAAVEPHSGQLGVAYVTSNRRLNSYYPNSYCGVVWDYITTRRGTQIAQFSWTKDGASDRVRNDRTWERALNIAKRFAFSKKEKDAMCPEIEATRKMREYIRDEYGIDRTNLPPVRCDVYEARLGMKLVILDLTEPDPTNGATNYHADYVNPRWSRHKTMVETTKISRHIFYVDTKIAPKPQKRL